MGSGSTVYHFSMGSVLMMAWRAWSVRETWPVSGSTLHMPSSTLLPPPKCIPSSYLYLHWCYVMPIFNAKPKLEGFDQPLFIPKVMFHSKCFTTSRITFGKETAHTIREDLYKTLRDVRAKIQRETRSSKFTGVDGTFPFRQLTWSPGERWHPLSQGQLFRG